MDNLSSAECAAPEADARASPINPAMNDRTVIIPMSASMLLRSEALLIVDTNGYMPADRDAFDCCYNLKKQNAEPDKDEQRSPDQRAVQRACRRQQQVTNAAVGADEFADDCADNGQRDGDLQAGENLR